MWHNTGKMRVLKLGCLGFAGVVPASIPALAQGEALRKSASLIKADRPLRAEAVLRTIGERDPDLATTRATPGFLLLRRAAMADAEAAFREALRLAPDSGAARFGLGAVLFRREAPEAAVALPPHAAGDPGVSTQANTERIRGLFLAGREEKAFLKARQLLADFPAAAKEFEIALSLRPAWGAAHYNLAMVYRQMRQYDRALEQARMADQEGVPLAQAATRTLSAYLSRRVAP